MPASERAVVESKKTPTALASGDEVILLVDDEDYILGIGKEMLEALGYTVLTAGSGADAVEAYQHSQDNIQLVILDMVMPGMNGVQTFGRLRAINPNVRTLLASGYSLNKDAAEVIQRGCNGFIQKPFDISQLSQKVREILDQSQPER